MTLSNLAPIANEYAALKAQIDALTARLDEIKELVKATGLELIEGDHVALKISLAERVSVSTAAVRKLLTAEQFADCSKASVYSVIRVAAKAA